jgi:FtsH-binding integral membrane protein
MSYAYEMDRPLAVRAGESERATFIRRTYLHLAGAILAFVALEFLIFNSVSSAQLDEFMVRYFASPISLLLIMGAYIGVSMFARRLALNGGSSASAYAGLALYTAFEVVFFVPILHIAVHYVKDPTILPTAGILTLSMFGGLTLAAFTTKKDFSFLRPILSIGFFLMLGLILAAVIFPGSLRLGLWFSFLGVALASAAILYDTSNVIHHFRTNQYVAASLSLFASIATLFYYILMILIQTQSRD